MPRNERQRLIVLRHAHRHKTWGAEFDNGLSAKGLTQAGRAGRYFYERFSKQDVRTAWIVSSPKRRCVETLEPIVHPAQCEAEVLELLDEGREGESLEPRALEFKRLWLESGAELTVACVHGDWPGPFFEALLGLPGGLELSKGAWAEVEREGVGAPRLVELIQDFKPFRVIRR